MTEDRCYNQLTRVIFIKASHVSCGSDKPSWYCAFWNVSRLKWLSFVFLHGLRVTTDAKINGFVTGVRGQCLVKTMIFTKISFILNHCRRLQFGGLSWLFWMRGFYISMITGNAVTGKISLCSHTNEIRIYEK